VPSDVSARPRLLDEELRPPAHDVRSYQLLDLVKYGWRAHDVVHPLVRNVSHEKRLCMRLRGGACTAMMSDDGGARAVPAVVHGGVV
jgi:hypothetical protein